jgi:glucose/arabinose dehydrogenase
VLIAWAAGVDPGAAEGNSLNVPSGWTVEVLANVPGARLAAWSPDGSLVVTQGAKGSVTLVSPAGPGEAATVSTLASGLSRPEGIAFVSSGDTHELVIAEESRLVAWTYRDSSTSEPRVIIDSLPTSGHGAKALAIDGDTLYFSLGSSSNRDPADRAADPERAVIARIGLDGSDYRVFARGVRNGFGLAIAPDGSLFTAVNQSDNQPYPFDDDTGLYGQVVTEFVNENPVEQVTRVTEGADLGWPHCMPDRTSGKGPLDLGYVPDPLLTADGGALDCAALEPVQLGLPAHSAPLGLAFTSGTSLEPTLGEGAFITSHGSWNREPPREPSVVFSPWDDQASALGMPEPLVTGFQNEDGSRWGRAVMALPGPDGALYVTDDLAGLVYRIAPPEN